jgi:hypothetical protein
MLKSLLIENFTVFSSARFDFAPGINVIVGENGTGKTHLLKAAYCLNRAWPDLMLGQSTLSRKRAEVYLEKRLMGLFQPEYLANLIRRGNREGRLAAEVVALLPTIKIGMEEELKGQNNQFPFGCLTELLSWELTIHDDEELSSIIPETAAVNSEVAKSIFIPSKEIVSFYEGLGGLLDQYEIKLDATYRDMVSNFDFPELTQPPRLPVFEELEDILGGLLKLKGRKLVFIEKDGRQTEAPLLAEGFRKLAMLPYFIRHGVIRTKGETLFWDEPETNLNPRLIAKLAEMLVALAKTGIQVILATHSLFLLKEIDLQLQQVTEVGPVPARFFALALGENGVEASAGDSLEEIEPITALDMEIDQADRYREWYHQVSRAE